MTVAQPFPVLASADNSRSASPAPSSGSPGVGGAPGSQRNGKGKGKGGPSSKPTQASSSKPRHKKQPQQQKEAVVAAGQGSETNTSTSASAGEQQQQQQQVRSSGNNNGKHKNKHRKAQAGSKPASVAVANEQPPSGKENVEASRPSDAGGSVASKPAAKQRKPRAPTTSAGEDASKKQGKASRRRTVASTDASRSKPSQIMESGMDATQSFAPSVSADIESHAYASAPLARSSSSSALPMAMIVPGENGRARVLFNPQAMDNDHPLANATPSPRFSTSSVQSARGPSAGAHLSNRARFPAHYGDNLGLGLRSPMSPALPSAPVNGTYSNSRSITTPSASMAGGSPSHAAPPIVRHRSLTSTQLRSNARSFSPQSQYSQHQHQNQNQQYHHYQQQYSHHHYQPQQQQHSQHHYQQHQQHQQPHSNYYHQQAQQQQPTRRLSSASSAGYDGMAPPLSAPAGGSTNPRGRSQSMSTHISMTGLRISMAQSRPGNVLAPHLPLLTRAASGGAVQPNTYANGGYFATRRASVSNVGLAVDPSHSIRIPTIMFQKPKPEDLAKAASAAASSVAAGASPSSQSASDTAGVDAETVSAAAADCGPAAKRSLETSDSLITPMTGGNSSDLLKSESDEPTAGEALAMQRLQEMISSLRTLTQAQSLTPKADKKKPNQSQNQVNSQAQAQDQAPTQSQSQSVTSTKLADIDVTSTAAIQMPPTPAAHPTSRFDSILEEDEDDEADEEMLDAEDSSVTASSHHESSDAATGYSSGAYALDGAETSSGAAAPALFAA
ncbi:hypothetical protein LPJ57_005059 [Coemansia sp. RSA 486]|nr:hypothetical protein LPJ57_005059 [Coemansia sp. RSA 486]